MSKDCTAHAHWFRWRRGEEERTERYLHVKPPIRTTIKRETREKCPGAINSLEVFVRGVRRGENGEGLLVVLSKEKHGSMRCRMSPIHLMLDEEELEYLESLVAGRLPVLQA